MFNAQMDVRTGRADGIGYLSCLSVGLLAIHSVLRWLTARKPSGFGIIPFSLADSTTLSSSRARDGPALHFHPCDAIAGRSRATVQQTVSLGGKFKADGDGSSLLAGMLSASLFSALFLNPNRMILAGSRCRGLEINRGVCDRGFCGLLIAAHDFRCCCRPPPARGLSYDRR